MRSKEKWMEEREEEKKEEEGEKREEGEMGGKREGWRRGNLKSLVIQVKGVVRFGNHNLDWAGSIWG